MTLLDLLAVYLFGFGAVIGFTLTAACRASRGGRIALLGTGTFYAVVWPLTLAWALLIVLRELRPCRR